jgi:Ca2+-binding RTX toxin-like protein
MSASSPQVGSALLVALAAGVCSVGAAAYAKTLNGGLGSDTLRGTPRGDVIFGAEGPDSLVGLRGDDLLMGETGPDTLRGGPGGDVLNGGSGQDRLSAGSGGDVAYGGFGPDRIDGGLGDDVLDGASDNDTINGGPGADVLHGGSGGDVLAGGSGDDVLYSDSGPDILSGGPGDDALYANTGAIAQVDCGPGQDTLYVDPGAAPYSLRKTLLRGATGCERVLGLPAPSGPSVGIRYLASPVGGLKRGTDLDDVLLGGPGADVLRGGEGNDVLWGQRQGDIVSAAPDELSGGAGDDIVYGGPGPQLITGGAGADFLESGISHGYISGGAGDDLIRLRGHATNTVSGGGGQDVIRAAGTGRDRISCGPGRDVVYADADDRVAKDCERVVRNAGARIARVWATLSSSTPTGFGLPGPGLAVLTRLRGSADEPIVVSFAADEPATFECRLYRTSDDLNRPWQACAPPWVTTEPGIPEVRAIDQSGHVNTAYISTGDQAAFRLRGVVFEYVLGPPAEFDASGYVTDMSYRVDVGPWLDGEPGPIGPLDPGPHSISLRVRSSRTGATYMLPPLPWSVPVRPLDLAGVDLPSVIDRRGDAIHRPFRIRLALSAPARLTVRVSRIGHHPRLVGELQASRHAGASTITLPRSVASHLRPGRYRALIVARAHGQTRSAAAVFARLPMI